MTWIHNSEPFLQCSNTHYGFVYTITNNISGKKYIGKKFFWHKKSRIVKGKKKKFLAESDWKDYFGSSEALLEDVKSLGESNFTREIIYLCKSKSECSYKETYEIFNRNALLSEDYYNSWVSVRINKKNVFGKI
jgi:hypothetical protein